MRGKMDFRMTFDVPGRLQNSGGKPVGFLFLNVRFPASDWPADPREFCHSAAVSVSFDVDGKRGAGYALGMTKTHDDIDSPLLERCREKGLKMTGQRRVIAYVLSEADDHPDVEELYRRAIVIDPKISVATVYRTVRIFEEQGILQRRNFGSGRARYEATDHGQHYHLIDVASGKVEEFHDGELDALLQKIAEQMGYDLVTTRLEIYGRTGKERA